ncbi:MAG: hypothetical protein WDO71_08540 [Bacteroidota bacterium]
MAFNNVGTPITIVAGATHGWWYTRGGNFGFQHAGADVKTPGGPLISFNQGKKMENNGSITYVVDIKNTGSLPVLYNLQGGGAV